MPKHLKDLMSSPGGTYFGSVIPNELATISAGEGITAGRERRIHKCYQYSKYGKIE